MDKIYQEFTWNLIKTYKKLNIKKYTPSIYY